MQTTCEICGQEDLFSYVTGEGVCSICTLRFGIPDRGYNPEIRRQRIDAAKALLAAAKKEVDDAAQQ